MYFKKSLYLCIENQSKKNIMSKTTSNIKRIWLLYGSFFAIISLCLVLFFSNLIASEEPTIFQLIDNQMKNSQQYAVGITDLPCDRTVNSHNFAVTGTDSTIAITASVERFDIAVVSDEKTRISSPLTTWAMVLQSYAAIAIVAIFVLMFILVVASFRSIKSGRIFQQRGVKWIRVIGILLLTLSLAIDTSVYLERGYAMTLLSATDWIPDHHFTIHFTRIIFAIIILFVAEILNIGYDIQKEQDLTI